MTYGSFLIHHPLFWAAIAGIAAGGAVATATRFTRRTSRPRRARSRKWTAVWLWLTVTVIAVVGGIFVPSGFGVLSVPSRYPSLYVAAGALLFCGLGLRFPRVAGIPAIFIVAVVAVMGPLVMRPFVPVREEALVASARVLAADEASAHIEVVNFSPVTSDAPQIVNGVSPRLTVETNWIGVSDYLFFLGASAGVVLSSVTVGPPDAAPQLLAEDPYADTRLAAWIVGWLPLLELETVRSEPVDLALLREYEVVCQDGAEVVIRQVQTGE